METQSTSVPSVVAQSALAALFPGVFSDEPNVGEKQLPALRQEVIVSNRLVDSLVALASQLFPGTRQQAERNVRGRLYMSPGDPTKPHVVAIRWEANVREDEASPRARYKVEVDGKKMDITVYPLFVCGIQFDYLVKSGKTWDSNGVFQCLLLRPRGGDESSHWHAIPLGMAPEQQVKAFNALAMSQGRDVTAIYPHSREALGAQRIEWTPTDYFEKEYGGKKRTCLGWIGGKIVFLAPGSSFLYTGKTKEQDGEKVEVVKKLLPGIWRYTETQNSVELSLVGKPGEVGLKDPEAPQLESGAFTIDPYRAVGQEPTEVDPDKIAKRIAYLSDSLSDPANPTVLYARALGLVEEGDDLVVIRMQVEKILRIASKMLTETMQSIFQQSIGRLNSVMLLKREDILGDDEERVVRRRVRGEDAATRFFSEHLAPFNWEYPMHRKVRTWILNQVLGTEKKT